MTVTAAPGTTFVGCTNNACANYNVTSGGNAVAITAVNVSAVAPSSTPNRFEAKIALTGSIGPNAAVTMVVSNATNTTTAGTANLSVFTTQDSAAVSRSYTIAPAAPSKLAFAQQPISTVPGRAITPAPTVQVQDIYGNAATASGVSVTLASNPTDSTMTGNVATTNAAGLATFSTLVMHQAGSYTLTASAAALTSATSSSFALYNTTTPGPFYVDAANGSDSGDGLSASTAFKTLTMAKAVVEEVNTTAISDITVNLLPGEFVLTSPLSLGPADSGFNGHQVIWQAANPANPPVISAAKAITPTAGHAWSYSSAKRLWSLSGVTNLNTRDLWINGHTSSRVHSCIGSEPCGSSNTYSSSELTMIDMASPPGSGPHYADTPTGMVHSFQNPSAVEFIYRSDSGRTGAPWTEPRCGVSSVTGTLITMDYCFTIGRGKMHPPNRVDQRINLPSEIENAFELFDPVANGNQWYWNPSTSTLYYQADRTSTEQTQAPTVVAGGLNGTLVSIAGTSTNPLTNLQFNHIAFEHTTWIDPSGPNGWIDGASGTQLTSYGTQGCPSLECKAKPPAAVETSNATNLRFDNDTFAHLGAAGLDLGTAVSNSTVTNSAFQDVGANGLMLGDFNGPSEAVPGNPPAINDSAVNNTFNPGPGGSYAAGNQYRGSVGIWAGYTTGLLLQHNQLHQLPYAGIHIGWGWNNLPPAGTPGPRGNQIVDNYVDHSDLWLWDGSPVYSVGDQPNQLIRGNVLTDAPQAPAGIYLDQGSEGVTILNNVVANVRYNQSPYTSPPGTSVAAGGVFVHACNPGTIQVINNFLDTLMAAGQLNAYSDGDAAACSISQNGGATLPRDALPASLLSGVGVPTGSPGAPPTTPGTPVSSLSAPRSQALSWTGSTDSTDAVTGYEVDATDPTFGTIVAAASAGTSATAVTASATGTQSFSVLARDAAGYLSSASAPLNVTPPADLALGRPATMLDANGTTLGASPSWTPAGVANDGDVTNSVTPDPTTANPSSTTPILWRLRIDLAATSALTSALVVMPTPAYASSWAFETSPDGTTWTRQATVTGFTGGSKQLTFSPSLSNVRHIRIVDLQNSSRQMAIAEVVVS
jgi:hypothetical protein